MYCPQFLDEDTVEAGSAFQSLIFTAGTQMTCLPWLIQT